MVLFPGPRVSQLCIGDRGKPHVIVGKNKMCLRYSIYRTSPLFRNRTRQIGPNIDALRVCVFLKDVGRRLKDVLKDVHHYRTEP